MSDLPKHRLVLSSPHAPQMFHAVHYGTFDDFDALTVDQFHVGRERRIELRYEDSIIAWNSDSDAMLIPLVLTRYDAAPVIGDKVIEWPRKHFPPPEPPIASAGAGPDKA